MIEQKKRDNPNLEKLKGQMKDMSQDFEDMKHAREEAKRRLEKRFDDAYAYFTRINLLAREIEKNKQFTIQQMQMVHETLDAF